MEAMILSVSTGRTATLVPSAASASLEPGEFDSAAAGRMAVLAAIELMRNWRLFIGDFPF
jgi:hypothetical protein